VARRAGEKDHLRVSNAEEKEGSSDLHSGFQKRSESYSSGLGSEEKGGRRSAEMRSQAIYHLSGPGRCCKNQSKLNIRADHGSGHLTRRKVVKNRKGYRT